MLALPAAMIRLLRPMERVFRESTWEYATVLLVGAILAPAKRMKKAAPIWASKHSASGRRRPLRELPRCYLDCFRW